MGYSGKNLAPFFPSLSLLQLGLQNFVGYLGISIDGFVVAVGILSSVKRVIFFHANNQAKLTYLILVGFNIFHYVSTINAGFILLCFVFFKVV